MFVHFKKKKRQPRGKKKHQNTYVFYCDTRVGVASGGKVGVMWWLVAEIPGLLGLTYFQKELKPKSFPGTGSWWVRLPW